MKIAKIENLEKALNKSKNKENYVINPASDSLSLLLHTISDHNLSVDIIIDLDRYSVETVQKIEQYLRDNTHKSNSTLHYFTTNTYISRAFDSIESSNQVA